MLRVQAAHGEEGIERPLVAAALAEELRLMADWLELDDVGVAARGDLAADLVRARSQPPADARQPAHHRQPGRLPRPVPLQGRGPGPPHHRAQRPGHDHDVVRVADHRQEVGHEVDGREEVGQQQPQPGPHRPRQRAVGGQPADEPHDVREQPQRVPGGQLVGAPPPQEREQHQPEQEHPADHGDDRRTHSTSPVCPDAPAGRRRLLPCPRSFRSRSRSSPRRSSPRRPTCRGRPTSTAARRSRSSPAGPATSRGTSRTRPRPPTGATCGTSSRSGTSPCSSTAPSACTSPASPGRSPTS